MTLPGSGAVHAAAGSFPVVHRDEARRQAESWAFPRGWVERYEDGWEWMLHGTLGSRWAVVAEGDPHAPLIVLVGASDAMPEVVCGAWPDDLAALDEACSASTPAGRLARLSWASPAVRLAVAAHPSCPPSVLERLAVDPEDEVADAAASHPNAPDAARSVAALRR